MSDKDALCPGEERVVKRARNLSDETFQRLVARRSRALTGEGIGPIKSRDQRVSAEDSIIKFYEKINEGNDFLPARYLRDGAKCADAVCRINLPSGYGSGSLIANGQFILTNNHVLEDEYVAAASSAEFGYEEGGDMTRVALKPEQFFITDEELDFTIVACDGSALSDIEPLQLLRNPATVTRHDQVNIIQHPRGHMKQIAIHENRVKRVKDLVLHYETDTEPGSSGSPVFNNEWELVGLHHAGWRERGTDKATNEGIRISAIVAHLMAQQYRESTSSAKLEELLSTIEDSSPYLGFFDVDGVTRDDNAEIEIPDFTGSPDFADIGFWNIEHFNSRVTNSRVNDVAEVLSKLSMDVMGLTEVEKGALDRLKVNMAARGDQISYVYLDANRSQDLAVLYDEDTTIVDLATDISQRHTDRINARTRDNKTAFPRPPLIAKCAVMEGENNPIEFVIIVVHLKAFGDAQSRSRRRLASEILAEIIKDIQNVEGLPVVLGGDFNEVMDTNVLSALTRSPDLFSLTADDADDGAISYVGSRHRSLIDHIMVSSDVQPGGIMGDDAAIVRLDRSVSRFSDLVSDHVPVVCRLVYRDEPIDNDNDRTRDEHVVDVPEGTKHARLIFES